MQPNQQLAIGLSLSTVGVIALAICIFYLLHCHKKRILAEHTASTLEAQAARANGTPTGDGPLLHLSNSVIERIAPLPVRFQHTRRPASSIPTPVQARAPSPRAITGIKRVSSIPVPVRPVSPMPGNKRVSSLPVPVSPVTPMPGNKRVSWAALPRADRTHSAARGPPRDPALRRPTPMSFYNISAGSDADVSSSSEASSSDAESPGSLIVTLVRTRSSDTVRTRSPDIARSNTRLPLPTRPTRYGRLDPATTRFGRLTPETTIRIVAVGAAPESPEREAARYGGRVMGGRDSSSNWIVYDYSPRRSVSNSSRRIV